MSAQVKTLCLRVNRVSEIIYWLVVIGYLNTKWALCKSIRNIGDYALSK